MRFLNPQERISTVASQDIGRVSVTTNEKQTLHNKTLAAPILTSPTLGTPVSGDLSNCSGITLTSSNVVGVLFPVNGGTGLDLSSTGGAHQVLKEFSAGVISVGQLAFTDISGAVASGQVPNLDASKITTGQLALARGGTNADLSATGGTSQVLRQSSLGAAVTVSQLAASDLSSGAFGGTPVSTTSTLSVGTGAAFVVSAGGIVTTYANASTQANGVPAINSALNTSASAAVNNISLVASGNAGTWEITYHVQLTTPGGVSSTLGGTNGFTLSWTTQDGSVSMTNIKPTYSLQSAALNANTTSEFFSGSVVLQIAAASAITFSIDYTSAGTAMVYEYRVKALYLG